MKVNNSFFLGKNKISLNEPVYIIAEVGVNHNGDLKLAKKLIQKAAACGANCVKFQTFKADRVVTHDAPKAVYQLKTTSKDESQLSMLEKLEMDMDSYREIMHCCEENGVLFMSTPYNIEDVDFLEELGVPAYKLASMHAAEPWFASYVAKTGKPVILSTGMATLDEVRLTVDAMRKTGNEQIILLQCTTNYPSLLEDTNLLAMQSLAKEFGLIVGYSDHTSNDIACIVSIGLGAKVIEKHFTLDKSMKGPDQSTSATPDEFSRLVKAIRSSELVLGSSIKQPCLIEKENMIGMRRSIVANKNIKKGEVMNELSITFKRPATGLNPKYFEELIGQRVTRNIAIDEQIQWSDFDK